MDRQRRHGAQPDDPARQHRPERQRLARRQPGDRPLARRRASLRRRPLLQRPAGRDHRAQEGRHASPPTSPLPTPSCRPTCGSSRWRSGSPCSRVASDGLTAKYGTPFTPLNHFSPWNVDDDGKPRRRFGEVTDDGPPRHRARVAHRRRLQRQSGSSSCMRNYVAFDDGAEGLSKRIAKPHQYFAVSKAVGTTVDAVESDGKAGVVWHTQGSGKSMEMELYTHAVQRHPQLLNPTIVVITDRTELDGQLYDTFAQSLPAAREAEADHAHGPTCGTSSPSARRAASTSRRCRSSACRRTRRRRATATRCCPTGATSSSSSTRRTAATTTTSTATPATSRTPCPTPRSSPSPAPRSPSTTATPESVFGDYIDIYDLTRAVADGATVPVYFEPRLIKMRFAEGRHRGGRRPSGRRGRPPGSTTSSGTRIEAARRRGQRRLRGPAAPRRAGRATSSTHWEAAPTGDGDSSSPVRARP